MSADMVNRKGGNVSTPNQRHALRATSATTGSQKANRREADIVSRKEGNVSMSDRRLVLVLAGSQCCRRDGAIDGIH